MSPGDEAKDTGSDGRMRNDYGGDVLGAAEIKRSDDGDDQGFGGGGGVIQNSAASRARVLQQQREMAMKRRSNQMQSGMMMRTDGPRASNLMSGMDSQNTPAMRQFSAPKKAVEDDEDSEDDEWSDPNKNRSSKKKIVKSDFMGNTGKRREGGGYERQESDWSNKDEGIDLREEEAESRRRLRQEREREQRRREDEEREGGRGGGRGGGERCEIMLVALYVVVGVALAVLVRRSYIIF